MMDYRDIKKKYNSITSIEMIEAVGQNYLKKYFQKIKDGLVDNGKAAIQAITINDNLYDSYKKKRILFKNIFFQVVFYQVKKV